MQKKKGYFEPWFKDQYFGCRRYRKWNWRIRRRIQWWKNWIWILPCCWWKLSTSKNCVYFMGIFLSFIFFFLYLSELNNFFPFFFFLLLVWWRCSRKQKRILTNPHNCCWETCQGLLSYSQLWNSIQEKKIFF